MQQTVRGIFLDDERYVKDVTWLELNPHVQWEYIRTFDEMAEFIKQRKWVDYGYISFDHDLNQEFHHTGVSPDGYTLMKMLVVESMDSGLELPKCSFHTKNPVGRKNMEEYYFNYLNFLFHVD